MKRSRPASIAALLRGASSRIVWCIVGTAVYQVGRTSLNQAKKRNALKPGEQETAPPAARLLRVAGDQAVDMEQRHDVEADIVRRSAPECRRY